jgi:hypothetical protein
MPTGSLLSRMRNLLECEESRDASDRPDVEETEGPGGIIEFKESTGWSAAHRDLKKVLARREHLPTALERRDKRMARAAANKTKEKRN